jgi:hypothetical protein
LVTLSEVRTVLADALRIGSRAESWRSSTGLLGSVPELDSIAVAGFALERRLEVLAADDGTLGGRSSSIEQKLHV